MRRIMMTFLLLWACDPDGKKNCAWVLEPEPSLKGKVEEGYIPMCARNRRTMKQDCRLQATEEQAREYMGKMFRYSDLKVKSVALPRSIKNLTFCEP